MWGTDMTQTITIREGRANVFVAVEHANSEVDGIHASGRPIASRPWSRSGRACTVLRSHRAQGGAWIEAASRSWLQLHVRRFPGRNRIPGDRSFALLRARAPGQRRAEHFIRTKENAVGADFRHHRRAASRARQIATATTKPGSSPGTAIVPQSKCGPTNVGLIRMQSADLKFCRLNRPSASVSRTWPE